MHSIACFFGFVFLLIFALIAIPILILVAKFVGLAIIGGVIALIVLGVWTLRSRIIGPIDCHVCERLFAVKNELLERPQHRIF
jgi:hypothetical protein